MSTRIKGAPALAKGQLWKTDEAYIEIVDLKRLIHYRLLKHPGQRLVRTRMSSLSDLETYLRSHNGELVD